MTQLAIRLDEPAEAALERLVTTSGQTRSEIVREAVISLDRATLIRQMREESLAVSRDDADVAEAGVVLDEMRHRRAW